MAELILRVPGEPDRRVPLPAAGLLVGRHDACGLTLPEKKASKQHLQVLPRPDGAGWVALDLQSSNGTLLNGERILRRALASGDVLTIGDTTLELEDAGAGPGAVPVSVVGDGQGDGGGREPPVSVRVGGSLALATTAAPAPAPTAGGEAGPGEPAPQVDAEVDPEEAARAAQAAVEMEVRRARVAGRRSVTRAGLFAGASVVVLVAVQLLAGGVADQRASERGEAEAALEILKDRDRPYEILADRFAHFKSTYPRSRRLVDLERVVAAAGKSNERRAEMEAELDRLRANAVGRSDAEIAGRLELLLARVPEGDALRSRIDLELTERRRRDEESLARELTAAERAADLAVAQGAYGSALRRLAAFAASHPLPRPEADERLRAKRRAIATAAGQVADATIAKAEGTADPDLRRRILLEGVRALAGTSEADRVASSLARVAGGALPSVPTPGAPPPLPGTGSPAAPTRLTSDVLADVAKAEGLARERRWSDAAAAYDRLIALDVAARVKADWVARREDLGRLVGLVKDLADAVAAAGDKGVRVRLAAGPTDGAGVPTKRGGAEATTAWAGLSAPDLLALLGHGTLGPDKRLALATLAADLGERATAIEHLTPLVGLESHRDRAFEVIARRLEGRVSVPEGGYLVYEGDLVDRAEHAKRLEARHLADLQTEAGALLGKIAADPVFKKLEALRAKRDELDKRRAYALLAIFNETHWPYPHDPPAVPQGAYAAVTVEVQKRWHLVEEIWNDPTKVVVGKSPSVERILERHAAILKELEAKGLDPAPFRAAMEPWALYATEGSLTIRTYFRDKEERDLLAYNRFVMNTYNPGHPGGASDPEIEQIRITNEYRAMMGYMTTVQPGGSPVGAIDGSNVVAILDQARETSRVPLRAVRIDERLVKSARGHSEDMSKRGFFDHFAPPNPATGEGRTSPFDRMAKAGYQGGGASENIAMAGGPMEAHLRWLNSSGHHRNILSAWTDQGVGFAGGRWTQNFGSGGGALPEIPGTAPTEK